MIDPRPRCIVCGERWVPSEGVDATVVSCCESGEPPKGSRLWRCELELGKARDEVARLREALEMIARPTVDTPTGDVARKALASTTPSAPVADRSASDDAPSRESRSPETATSATHEPGVSEEGPGADLEAIREAARAWRKIVDPTVVAEIVAWLRKQEMNGGHMALADAIEKKWGSKP